MKLANFLFTNLTLLSIILGCNQNTTDNTTENEALTEIKEDSFEPVQSICIWDQVSLRDKPTKEGKWITALNLGEKVWYLGESKKDSTDKDRIYARIRLSDDTEGWVSEYGIVIDAEAGALVLPCQVYKRPDLLTETEIKFDIMEMVAVRETEGKWALVTGRRKEKSGWVLIDRITIDQKDVAVGILASKAISEAEEESEKMETIKSIIHETPYPDAVFISYLRDELARYQENKNKD